VKIFFRFFQKNGEKNFSKKLFWNKSRPPNWKKIEKISKILVIFVWSGAGARDTLQKRKTQRKAKI